MRPCIIALLGRFALESALEPAQQAARACDQFQADVRRGEFRRTRAGDDHDLRAFRQHRPELQAVTLAHAPLYPVALDRIPDAPRYGDPQPRPVGGSAGAAVEHEVSALAARSMALNYDELARIAQPIGFSKS